MKKDPVDVFEAEKNRKSILNKCESNFPICWKLEAKNLNLRPGKLKKMWMTSYFSETVGREKHCTSVFLIIPASSYLLPSFCYFPVVQLPTNCFECDMT